MLPTIFLHQGLGFSNCKLAQVIFPFIVYTKLISLLSIFFSLDIEGAEFGVLKTVPWDKVDIEVLLVELIHAGLIHEGTRDDVHKFLSSKNYFYLGTIGMIFYFKSQKFELFFILQLLMMFL